ncbi:MAG: transglycosylase domain-containing protein [Actinomycetota bacterium]
MRPKTRRSAAVLIALFTLAGTACSELANLPTLTAKDLKGIKLAESSKIFAGDGTLITTLHGVENRTIIPLSRIPQHFQDAVISIEDERFYEHEGVDMRAVFRALVRNISSGDVEEGGSTITQQYVKNTLIAPGETAARTLRRKINEAALARQLEEKLTKEQILERYLNTVYFGEGAYGVQAAAKTFFDKGASRLTLSQGALLAGVIRSPESYDPIDRKKAAKKRRNLVISKMEELGYIDALQAERARKKDLQLELGGIRDEYPAPYFVDYVRRLIKSDPRFKAVGKDPEQREQQMFQGGLRIYTTVDLEDQAAAERAVDAILVNGSDPHASVVGIDPRNGYIKAMVGGRDFFARRKEDRFAKLNLATVIEPNLDCERNKKGNCKKPYTPAPGPGAGRQAGSAFKPFALAAAIDEGIPLSKVFDAAGSQITIPGADNGADYVVQNYEGSSFGKVSLLEATVNSVNIVYALLGQEVGVEDVVETAAEMGIRTPLLPVASAPLGTNSINPLDMASAYGTLATYGEHHPPVAITKIVDKTGRTIYQDRSESRQVLEPGVAYLTTTALEQVMIRGTGTGAQIGRPAAGKTGTAQEYRDAWFVGYTPNYVASVWVGYPEGQIEMKTSCFVALCRPTRIQVTGGSWPADIWQTFMTAALADVPVASFSSVGGTVTVTIDDRTYCLATESTPPKHRVEAQYARGTEPTEQCAAGDEVEIPDVTGFPEDDAVRIVEDAGFEVTIVEGPSDVAPGRVYAQSPGGGQLATPGSTVTLSISTGGGGGSATVPNVLGLMRAEAESKLRGAGYEVATVVEKEGAQGQAKKRSGRVWKQSPASGTGADRGSTVTIWVNP